MNSKPGEWYPEHILEWYKHKDYKNIRFLRYEDLKKVILLNSVNIAVFYHGYPFGNLIYDMSNIVYCRIYKKKC